MFNTRYVNFEVRYRIHTINRDVARRRAFLFVIRDLFVMGNT